MKIITIILVVVVILVIGLIWGCRAPEPYRYRTCMGQNWKKEFPDSKKEDIRNYLLLFVNAFGFRKDQILKFEPQDNILEIYNAIYPMKGWPDSLELETLARDIESYYKMDFISIWNEKLTLGELFKRASSA